MLNKCASLCLFLLPLGVPIVCVIVPVVIIAVDLIPMTVVKDHIYVICTVLQTAVVILGLFWWQRKIRKEEKQKADTEKIIAILSDHYDEAEEAHRILNKHLDALKSRKINTGQSTRTELDVLVYMCHGDNWSAFDSINSADRHDREGYGRENVMLHVHKIIKFFREFYYRLNDINRKCPDTIQSEFSSKVTEMGKTIYPFVAIGKARKNLIDKVCNYFSPTNLVQDHLESATRENISPICLLCCYPQGNTGQHTAGQPPDGSDETRGNANQQAMQSTPHYSYPGHDELKNEIPYIEFFRYKDGKMDCNIECKHSNLKNLESHVKRGKREILDKKDEIKDEIVELLDSEQTSQRITCDQEYLLHLIRIVMLKIKKNELNNERKRNFIEYVRGIDCSLVSAEKQILISKRALQNIETCVKDLEKTHKYILKLEDTPGFLENKAEEIRVFIRDRINVYQITT